MLGSLEISNREELTDIHALTKDLLNLVKLRDARLAYLASAGFERLTALRAAAAKAGIVWSNLLDTGPLEKERDLAEIYRGLMDRLARLTDGLQENRRWQRLDPSIVDAAVRVQEAWRTLKERDAA